MNRLQEINDQASKLRNKICNIKKTASEKEDRDLAILNEEAKELKAAEYAKRKVVALKFIEKVTRISTLLYRNAIMNRQPFELRTNGEFSYFNIKIYPNATSYSAVYKRSVNYSVKYERYMDTGEVDKFDFQRELSRCDEIIEELQDITHMLDGFETHLHCRDECSIW